MRWDSYKDDDTITRGELRTALQGWRATRESPVTFGAYHSVTSLVDDVFHDSQGKQLPVDNEDTFFTPAELRNALERLHYDRPSAKALDLLNSIREHREPVWAEGDVVKDANDGIWRRAVHNQWQRFGTNGFYGDKSAVRPLKRMTEES